MGSVFRETRLFEGSHIYAAKRRVSLNPLLCTVAASVASLGEHAWKGSREAQAVLLQGVL